MEEPTCRHHMIGCDPHTCMSRAIMATRSHRMSSDGMTRTCCVCWYLHIGLCMRPRGDGCLQRPCITCAQRLFAMCQGEETIQQLDGACLRERVGPTHACGETRDERDAGILWEQRVRWIWDRMKPMMGCRKWHLRMRALSSPLCACACVCFAVPYQRIGTGRMVH